jgi:hypothetical protein
VPASPRAAAEAAVDAAALTAGVSSAAVPKALQCLACGSQDQQLVRALKDFVAIRTVSNNRVSCARVWGASGAIAHVCWVSLMLQSGWDAEAVDAPNFRVGHQQTMLGRPSNASPAHLPMPLSSCCCCTGAA